MQREKDQKQKQNRRYLLMRGASPFNIFRYEAHLKQKTNRKPNPIDDLMKNMPGSKQGDDCQ